MSAAHLSSETTNALVDGELAASLEDAARRHLELCHACTLMVLQAHQLKGATKAAASGRFQPSADAMERMAASIKPPATSRLPATSRGAVIPIWRTVWGLAALFLMIAVSLGVWRQVRQSSGQAAEVLDQHLALLAESSVPQVISTDKHTVKPWFQGKLPFSFNIPERDRVAPDTTLVGADLAYLDGKPAAVLLFRIKAHRVSVFVTQADAMPRLNGASVRSGFTIEQASSGGLELVAVSDVDRNALSALLKVLVDSQ